LQTVDFKNRQISLKFHIFAGEVYSTLCVEWADVSFWCLSDVNRSAFHEDMPKQ